MRSELDIRDKVFNLISSLFQDQLFKYEGKNPTTRYEFIYLLQLINLIGQGKKFPIHSRNNWIQILRESQQPDGYFTSSPETNFTSRLALTAISIATLHQLGGDIQFPIYQANQFSNRQFTENWLREIEKQFLKSSQQEKDALASGKSILNTFILLDKAYCDGLLADTHLIFFFNCCDALARPESGFWLSTPTNTAHSTVLIDALFRTQAYIFFGRHLPYPKQMIQSIIKMRQSNGHFTSNASYFLLCDLAAVTLLVYLYQSIDFKRFWIRSALRRLLRAYHKTVARDINSIFQFDPDHPSITEAFLYEDEFVGRLNKIIVLYYFSLIQGLISLIIPEYKFATSGWNLKNASPSFTFSEFS